MTTGRVDVFVLGTGNKIWQQTWLDATGWQAQWSDLGCCLNSGPAATSWNSQSLDVWARGTNGLVQHRACRNLSNNCIGASAFAAWENGAGAPSVGISTAYADPGVTSWGVNRFDVFVTGTDNQLYHNAWSGGPNWAGWEPKGGSLASSPNATSWGNNRLDIVAKGSDGNAWHLAWQENSSWRGWETTNFAITSPPAITNRGVGKMHIYGIDNATNLWEDVCNGESDCRAATPGTLHKPSVRFMPEDNVHHRETTMVALPPSQVGCGGQAKLLSSVTRPTSDPNISQPGPIYRANVSCVGQSGCAVASTISTAGNPATLHPSHFSYDNQILRGYGTDGHPLYGRQTFECSPNCNPGNNEHVSEVFYKSTDCGATFTYVGKIDPTAVSCPAGGTYGDPQYDGPGITAPGGFDRFEVYRDPWSGTLYATANGTSGVNAAGNGDRCSDGLLFSSSDSGATWTKRQQLAFSSMPAPMTSTSSGRLYVLQCVPGSLKVQKFSNSGQTLDTTFTSTTTGCAWPTIPSVTNQWDIGGLAINRVGNYADATTTAGFDVLRVFVPRLDTSGNFFVVDVYSLEFRATPVFTKINTIKPATNYSIHFFTVIEPDLIGNTSSATNVAVAYWVEQEYPAPPGGAGSSRIMFASVRDIGSIATPARLSVTGTGAADDWDWATNGEYGDYLKGSVYYNAGSWTFYGQWTRPVSGTNMGVFTNWVTLAD